MAGTIRLSSSLDVLIQALTGDKEFQKLGGLDKLTKILPERPQ
jgi:hypothetical protein